jgi:DNA mismatch repair ATPase MutS
VQSIYYLLIIPLILIIAGILILRQKQRLKKLKVKLKQNWGEPVEKKRDFEVISRFQAYNQADKNNEYVIDDRTWQDLDMNEVYTLIDRTMTVPGEQYLYHLLKTPSMSFNVLQERGCLIKQFSDQAELRLEVQLLLSELGNKKGKYIHYLLWESLPRTKAAAFIYILKFMACLAFVSILSAEYLPGKLLIPVIIFTVNMCLHYYTKRKILFDISAFHYLGKLIRISRKIAQSPKINLHKIQNDLQSLLKPVQDLGRKMAVLGMSEGNVLYEYANIFFLIEARTYFAGIEMIRKRQKELQKIFEIIGGLDALISAASFRSSLNFYSEPVLSTDKSNIEISNIYHPLIKKPVSNSIQIDKKSVLVTGSNMSGKTTFLKTIGVNAVLAQTIFTVAAKEYRCPFLGIKSSIGRQDNLIEGKSYYLSEVESIHRLIKAADQPVVHLFIIDEIFRGTNSAERIAASIEILKYLNSNSNIVLAATHDLELTERLAGLYENYHFREQLSEYGLEFDYTIKPGPSKTRNAIALLEFTGYPKVITDKAAENVPERFTNSSNGRG